jgi:hypothetical protein
MWNAIQLEDERHGTGRPELHGLLGYTVLAKYKLEFDHARPARGRR